jgi:hypothetical protein
MMQNSSYLEANCQPQFSGVFSCAVIWVPKRRLLTIAAELSAPPSSPLVFRDLTLVASVFRHYEVLAIAETDMIDYYNQWFKRYGLWDFIEDILPPEQIKDDEVVVDIEGGAGSKLTAYNLSNVLALI